MSHPSRNDVEAYVAHVCRNCDMPEKDHLVVGTKLQCLFAPAMTYNDLPSNAWLKQAAAGPGGWGVTAPVYVGALPERTTQRVGSTWTPGPSTDEEIG
jgi:hypothetical protein